MLLSHEREAHSSAPALRSRLAKAQGISSYSPDPKSEINLRKSKNNVRIDIFRRNFLRNDQFRACGANLGVLGIRREAFPFDVF